MNVLLFVLLIASLLLAAVLVAPMLRRGTRSRRSPAMTAAIAAIQFLLGLLWVLYGALYLRQKHASRFGGWYAIILGLLWSWQGVRRLAQMRRR
jgi:hypothetical protein